MMGDVCDDRSEMMVGGRLSMRKHGVVLDCMIAYGLACAKLCV